MIRYYVSPIFFVRVISHSVREYCLPKCLAPSEAIGSHVSPTQSSSGNKADHDLLSRKEIDVFVHLRLTLQLGFDICRSLYRGTLDQQNVLHSGHSPKVLIAQITSVKPLLSGAPKAKPRITVAALW